MLLPFTGFGQGTGTPKSNYNYYGVHIWDESSSQADQYILKSSLHTINLLDWNGTPFYFFTASTCSKFSLRFLGSTNDPNSTCCGSSVPLKWQFYKPDGTLYAEYLEPETNITGEWEPNYGNFSTYTSGITPDFEITESGVYYLKCMEYYNGIWNPAHPNNNNNSIKINIVPEGFSDYTINAPDDACFGEFLCWSIEPFVDPSMIVSTNLPYMQDPCILTSTTTPNEIIVSIKNWCNDEITTISKSINFVDFRDFTLVNNVCINQTVNVGDITQCDGTHNIISYEWNWGDGTTSNMRYSSHSYASPGTYTVRLTVVVDAPDGLRTSTMAKPITVYSYPEAPIVSGVFNTCTNPGTFTITNPDANATYTWNASYSSGMSGTSTSQNITWNTTTFPLAPNYGMLTVIADNHGCTTTTDEKIWNCCNNINNGVLVSNTTITSLPNLTNQEYFFNGTVVIDNNINLQNTNINFGPEAKIIVNPPYTFTTNYSVLKAGCNYMWDGIYTNSTQSKVEILNSPRVSDAYNVVNSTNGGNYTLRNSTFQDNYIVVKATDYRPSTNINHPGSTAANMFKNQTNMIAPYLGQKSYTGFYIDNVYNLRVGEVEPENVNTFLNLFCGIQAYNSYITVIHNKFQNIQRSSLCSPGEVSDLSQLYCETAIHIAKKAVPYNFLNPMATIGGASTLDGNAFNSCDIAYNSYEAKQIIRNNRMGFCKTGISCRNVYTTGNLISSNTLEGNTSGIYLTCDEPYYKGITVENNDLINVGTYGIRVFNCKSAGLAKTRILNNTINYNAAIANGKGIYAVNCNAITITGNTIASATLTSSGLRKFFRGISLQNCPNSIVKSNPISKMGTAIYLEGLETGIQFQCNNMTQNYYGFYITNGTYGATVIDNQITNSTMPNDNQWTDHPSPTSGIPTYRITGDPTTQTSPIAQKNWFYRTGITYNPNITNQSNPAWYYITANEMTNNPASPCGSKGGDDEDYISNGDSTSVMEEIIPEYTNLAAQMRYMYMSMLYSYNYEQFMNETTQAEEGLYANIPLIAKINELAQNDSTINKAIELNNIFAPINDMENHRKFVNDVYLNYVAKGETPSSDLIDQLYAIADLSSSIGGEAVHIARAILNYEPTTRNKQDFDIPAKLTLNDNIQWYPNPANDILNVTSVETFVTGSKIELYDITGRMVLSTTIGTESNIANISLKDVKQGLYLCVIKNGEEIISSSKISVLKQ